MCWYFQILGLFSSWFDLYLSFFLTMWGGSRRRSLTRDECRRTGGVRRRSLTRVECRRTGGVRRRSLTLNERSRTWGRFDETERNLTRRRSDSVRRWSSSNKLSKKHHLLTLSLRLSSQVSLRFVEPPSGTYGYAQLRVKLRLVTPPVTLVDGQATSRHTSRYVYARRWSSGVDSPTSRHKKNQREKTGKS